MAFDFSVMRNVLPSNGEAQGSPLPPEDSDDEDEGQNEEREVERDGETREGRVETGH